MTEQRIFTDDKWLIDEIADDLVQIHGIKRVLKNIRTPFQQAGIVETCGFGMSLVLDGKIQSGAADEYIFHETLVQPAMLAHPNPESVFIAGGGEGATLREVLRHKSVKHVDMVDIDEAVVKMCKKHLPTFHRGAFEDRRSAVYYEDARGFIKNSRRHYDVAIIDLADPVDEGPAQMLFTREFYSLVKNKLKPGGIIAVQSGQSGWKNIENFAAINRTLKSIFKVVRPYQVYMPSFVDLWGFNTASDELDPLRLSAGEINNRIRSRIEGKLDSYDGITHRALFSLSKRIRTRLARTRRVITDKNPISVY